jgi:hypothetical protein
MTLWQGLNLQAGSLILQKQTALIHSEGGTLSLLGLLNLRKRAALIRNQSGILNLDPHQSRAGPLNSRR